MPPRPKKKDAVVLLYTAATADEAARIGRALVEERLAACVNILPGVRSIYRWKGKVRDAPEALGIAKTSRGKAEAAIARIRALHSYAVPEMLVLDVVSGNPDYLGWIAESTA